MSALSPRLSALFSRSPSPPSEVLSKSSAIDSDYFLKKREHSSTTTTTTTNNNNNASSTTQKRQYVASSSVASGMMDSAVMQTLEDLKRQNSQLKDAAKKLDTELTKYTSSNKKDKSGEPPTWLTNAQYLTSLLRAYDDRIEELESSLKSHQTELDSLQTKYTSAVHENGLLKEKVSSITNQYSHKLSEVSALMEPYAKVTNEEWDTANERIETLATENDVLMEQAKASAMEAERARMELALRTKELNMAKQKMNDDAEEIQTLKNDITRAINAKALAENEAHKSINEYDTVVSERERLEVEVRKQINLVRAYEIKTQDLKRGMEELTSRYQETVRESTLITARENDLMDSLRIAEADLEDYKIKYSNVMKDLSSLKDDNEKILKASKNLEERLADKDKSQVEHFKQLQKQIAQVEEFKLEKEKACLRERQMKEEVERLNAKLASVITKHRERTDSELSSLQARFLGERKKLLDEINQLETKCAELHSTADRAIREKRSAETELESLSKQVPAECDRLNIIIEELTTKLRSSEKHRVESEHRAESLANKLFREQDRIEKDKEDFSQKLDEVYRRLRRSERDLEEAKEEKLKLTTTLADSETQYGRLQEKHQFLESQYATEMAAVQQRYHAQVEELKHQLATINEAHSRTCRDMQNLLNEQRRTGDRWKQDTTNLTGTYERSISELRYQLSLANNKINELNNQVVKMNAIKTDLTSQVAEEKKASARLQVMLQNADDRAEASLKQIQVLLGKENEVLEEKKRLQKEVDRLRMEKDRQARTQQRLRTFTPLDTTHIHQPTLQDTPQTATEEELQAAIERLSYRMQERSRSRNSGQKVGFQQFALHDGPSEELVAMKNVEVENGV